MSVSPFEIVPVPDTAKPQDGRPGPLAVPVTVTGTVEPFSCPEAIPETVSVPAHSAEKFPATEFAV